MVERGVLALHADPGSGLVDVRRSAGRSVAVRAAAQSPLKLLTPRNHGHAAWVFAATFGGGLVDGDRIAIDARVAPGAALLLGTQASTKVYRSPRHGSSQSLRATVGDDALLAVVPDPVVCFEGARYEQRSEIHLGERSSLVWLDALTSGRMARGERWAFHAYQTRTRITRAGKPIAIDAQRIVPGETPMGRFDAIATLVFIGAPPPAPLPLARRGDLVESVSPIEGGHVVRVAASRAELLTASLRRHLAWLPAALGDDPFARKW
jgi:urease accessory protein